MKTETYARLLAQYARLAAEKQAESEAMESDWLRGFYAGQATAFKSAITVTRIMSGDDTEPNAEEEEVPEESINPLLDYLIAELPFNQPTTTQE